MNQNDLDQFKELLLTLKTQIMNGSYYLSKEDLSISSDDLADETDLASTIISQELSVSLRHRELAKLRAINEALLRLKNGYFGLCDECDELIGKKRLSLRPWTTLCITHAEELERKGIASLA